jgi:hypothetical protein
LVALLILLHSLLQLFQVQPAHRRPYAQWGIKAVIAKSFEPLKLASQVAAASGSNLD